jgi:hypothetical protein
MLQTHRMPASSAETQSSINRENVTSVSDYHRLLSEAGVLFVNRGGKSTFLVIQPE